MLKQNLHQKLQQKLSPNHIQLMKLVQLPTLAFEERVLNELEENPALEEKNEENEEYDNDTDTNIYEDEFINSFQEKEENNNIEDTSEINIDEYLNDDEIPIYKDNLFNKQLEDKRNKIQNIYILSFHEYLKEQLHTFRLNKKDIIISDFIIGNLDEYGYLRCNIHSLVEDISIHLGIETTEKKVENLIINYIQKLDPPGIGARGLQECLYIQIKNKNKNTNNILAYKIIKNYFEAFSKKHYSKLIQSLKITEKELKNAISIIKKLDPKPGKNYSENIQNIDHIIPDFIINIKNGILELLLNNKNTPELKISNSYLEMLESFKDSKYKSIDKKKTILFIKQKLDAAKYFIDALKKREQTLLLTMNAIMNYQKQYFMSGDEQTIKPMILKDIANKIKMDISTVSRVVNSKYVSTPYGVILIKDLFSEGIINEYGKIISTIEIKKTLFKLIKNENKKNTFTDEQLMVLLKNKGYILARRTVAKYREQLNIPVSRLRKNL